jgi:hypothetical protein
MEHHGSFPQRSTPHTLQWTGGSKRVRLTKECFFTSYTFIEVLPVLSTRGFANPRGPGTDSRPNVSKSISHSPNLKMKLFTTHRSATMKLFSRPTTYTPLHHKHVLNILSLFSGPHLLSAGVPSPPKCLATQTIRTRFTLLTCPALQGGIAGLPSPTIGDIVTSSQSERATTPL